MEGGKSVVAGTIATNDAALSESSQGWCAFLVIAATLLFNFALCFVNTNIAPVSNLHVIGSELSILTLTFALGCTGASVSEICFLVLLILYLTSLALVRGIGSSDGTDVKIVRDFLIPVAFFWLGRNISLRDADRIVRWAAVVTVGVGLFEYFFLDVFLKYFDVIGFYIARGTVADTESARIASGGLMVSGVRPEGQGRELLPWLLDSHRASSIFLEPPSLGNFGIIVALWAALRSKIDGVPWFGLLLLGLVCIVLADTRFAAAFLALGVLIIFLPRSIGTPLTAAMPFVAVLFLLTVITPADLASNDAAGRLAYAAFVLHEFNILNWAGLSDSLLQTFDAGYGYVFSEVGLFGVLVLWFCFMSLSGRSTYFYAFRNAIGAYLTTLLLISQSEMTIKTAALLWLLLGAAAAFEAASGGRQQRDNWRGGSRGPLELAPRRTKSPAFARRS
jgi:putative polymerase